MHSEAKESAHTHRSIAILLECHANQWDDFVSVASQQLSEAEHLMAGITKQLSKPPLPRSEVSSVESLRVPSPATSQRRVRKHLSDPESCLTDNVASLSVHSFRYSVLQSAATRVSASVETAAEIAARAVADLSEALTNAGIAAVYPASEDIHGCIGATPAVAVTECDESMQNDEDVFSAVFEASTTEADDEEIQENLETSMTTARGTSQEDAVVIDEFAEDDDDAHVISVQACSGAHVTDREVEPHTVENPAGADELPGPCRALSLLSHRLVSPSAAGLIASYVAVDATSSRESSGSASNVVNGVQVNPIVPSDIPVREGVERNSTQAQTVLYERAGGRGRKCNDSNESSSLHRFSYSESRHKKLRPEPTIREALAYPM